MKKKINKKDDIRIDTRLDRIAKVTVTSDKYDELNQYKIVLTS